MVLAKFSNHMPENAGFQKRMRSIAKPFISAIAGDTFAAFFAFGTFCGSAHVEVAGKRAIVTDQAGRTY